MVLSEEMVKELKEAFDENSENGKATIDQVHNAFKAFGETTVAPFKIREFMEKSKITTNTLNFEEFLKLCESIGLSKTYGSKLRDNVQTKSGITHIQGSQQSSEGTVHSLSDRERRSFANYLNVTLSGDPDVKKHFPLNPDSDGLFLSLKDGILLCKIVNLAAPNTIDERAINKKSLNTFQINENLTLAINSLSAIGCHVINVNAADFIDQRVHLILGLLWQALKIAILSRINLKNNPDLACLLFESEPLETLLSLTPEEILLRWVNFQLAKTTCPVRMTNYSSDIKDSIIYAHLMEVVLKGVAVNTTTDIVSCSDLTERATKVVQNSNAASIIELVQPCDIISGNAKLNLAFVAELFNHYPCLDKVQASPNIEETREEKTYRNWMNSLGIQPNVTYIYNDIIDGLALLKLSEIIEKGVVVWDKVNMPPFKTSASVSYKKIENCNYVVEVGKKLKLSLVGTAGEDIFNKNKMLVLGLIWQMMKLYTMRMLQDLSGSDKPISEAEILAWVNTKLKDSNMQLTSLKDPSIATSHPILEIIEAIRPKTLNRSYVKPGADDEEKLSNAMYAISLARKIGSKVYALPEDIVEGKSKMVMTIFACLMVTDLKNRK